MGRIDKDWTALLVRFSDILTNRIDRSQNVRHVSHSDEFDPPRFQVLAKILVDQMAIIG